MRVLAFVAAIALPIAAAFEAMLLGALPPWASLAAAAVVTVPVILGNPTQWTTVTIGAALAVFATHNAQAGARMVPIADPIVIDLVAGDSPAGFEAEVVTIAGHLRDEWVLDEYQVARGDRPDQNEAPPAVLVPLLPSPTEPMHIDDSTIVVIARIPGKTARGDEKVSLTGRLEKLPPGLAENLFAATPGAASAADHTVLLDTVAVATPARGLTLLAIAFVCALVGLWLMLVPRRPTQRDQSNAGATP
jgi:hypothetical protein